MARVKGGFLGNLAGSVGNVTFARARGGIQTARVRATPGNPRSASQQAQRGRFKQLQRFASAFLSAGLIRPFWRVYATGGLSAYNAFMRANSTAMPEGLDPGAAVLSRGNGLEAVMLAQATVSEVDPNAYVLTVESPTGGDGEDLLVGVIYHGYSGRAVVIDAGARRDAGEVEVPIPAGWADEGESLFAYAFAYRVEGSGVRLSDSSALKVTADPFEVPEAEVPPARTVGETPFGREG
jgi:hypothetical protein